MAYTPGWIEDTITEKRREGHDLGKQARPQPWLARPMTIAWYTLLRNWIAAWERNDYESHRSTQLAWEGISRKGNCHFFGGGGKGTRDKGETYDFHLFSYIDTLSRGQF